MGDKYRACLNCVNGKVWNEKTKRNDLDCTACNGTGRIAIPNL